MSASKKPIKAKAAPGRQETKPLIPDGFIDPWKNRTLQDYFSEIRKRFGAVRVLNVGSYQDESDYHINDLFVRPALSDEYISLGAADRKDEAALGVDLLDILKDNPRIVVLGDPGSGKSTLVSWLAWSLANPEKIRPVNRVLGQLIPLPFILREAIVPDLGKSSNSPDVDQLLEVFLSQSFAKGLDTSEGRQLLRNLFESEQLFLMFDGLDELSAAKKNWLRSFWIDHCWTTRSNPARAIITSRVVGYEGSGIEHIEVFDHAVKLVNRAATTVKDVDIMQGEISVQRINFAKLYYAAPFGKNRIDDFSRKWYRLRVKPQTSADERAVKFLDDVAQHPALSELRHSPLLLTFMAIVHNAKQRLPDGRVNLYRAIVEAYIEGLRSKDSKAYRTEDVHDALSAVAWEAQMLRDESEATDVEDADEGIMLPESRVKTIMTAVLAAKLGEEPSEGYVTEFLKHCKERTGLLYPRGEREPVGGGKKEEHYTFAHLSFQEYFACKAIYRKLARSWVIRSEEQRGEFSRAKLHRLTGRSIWTETFLLLFESLSDPDSPLDPADFAGYLFDCRSGEKSDMLKVSWSNSPSEAEVGEPVDISFSNYNRTRLLINCLADSRITLDVKLRIRIIRCLVQNSSPASSTFRMLLREILELEPLRSITIPIIAEVALANNWTHLELDSGMLESEAFSDLSIFTSVSMLNLLDFSIDQLAKLPCLTRITSVRTIQCDISKFRWVNHFPMVDFIYIHHCTQPCFSELARLEALRSMAFHMSKLNWCKEFTLPSLQSLELWIDGPLSISDLSLFPSISKLELFADTITNMSGFDKLGKLRELILWNSDNIKKSDLERLAHLDVLRVYDGVSNKSVFLSFHKAHPKVKIMTYDRDVGWKPLF